MSRYSEDAVMLWTHDLQRLELTPPEWVELLDDEERARALRFRHEHDRIAYVAAHALLRLVIANRIGLCPSALIISRDSFGKPFLDMDECRGIDLSLSHTKGMVAVALSNAGRVGVDVEEVDHEQVPRSDLAAYGLSAEERGRLESMGSAERSEAFIELWTAREAVAKADGRGLSLPFSSILIDFSASVAATIEGDDKPSRHWRLWREEPSLRHRLTLAWSGERGEVMRMKDELPLY
ncbi:4'-phosphopantetheinyl transferase family protein [Chlorobium ferrooxidans]|nr:4'-phosphopantetheinyl transferase superfamily protein [Chlorobium ferrooxidans]